MKQTSKYALSQWEKTDRILMEDFNADNTKVEAALTAHDAALAAKAAQTALNAEITARQQADTTLNNSINSEAQARQNADNAEAQARQAADNTINAALAKRGNCQIYCTTYTGAGTATSADTPRTFTFPYPPKMVIVAGNQSAYILTPAETTPMDLTCYNISTLRTLNVSFSGNSVSWWASQANAAMDLKDRTYYLLALMAMD